MNFLQVGKFPGHLLLFGDQETTTFIPVSGNSILTENGLSIQTEDGENLLTES